MAKIIPLSEGSFTVDGTKKFIAFDPQTDDLQKRGSGSLLVEIQPFLVITPTDHLLLDTGLGLHTPEGNLQLHQNLRNQGIDPGEITKVFLSHLHKDHAGGIAFQDEKTGGRRLSFPDATYYVNEKELGYAFEKQGTSYHAEDFSLLKEAPHMVLTGDEGDIDGSIHYRMTGGHSPYHQVCWIKGEDGILFFGGDVVPQLSHVKSRFIAKYDYDGRKSMQLRQQFVEKGSEENWTFLFYHDIRTPFIQLGNGASR